MHTDSMARTGAAKTQCLCTVLKLWTSCNRVRFVENGHGHQTQSCLRLLCISMMIYLSTIQWGPGMGDHYGRYWPMGQWRENMCVLRFPVSSMLETQNCVMSRKSQSTGKTPMMDPMNLNEYANAIIGRRLLAHCNPPSHRPGTCGRDQGDGFAASNDARVNGRRRRPRHTAVNGRRDGAASTGGVLQSWTVESERATNEPG